MLRPKKTIPKLAVAMLALTGCSGDGGGGAAGAGGGGTGGTGGAGGTGGSGGDDFAASVDAFCMGNAPCWQASLQGCINFYNAVNEYNADAECTAAMLTYFDCYAAHTCDEVVYPPYACDPEYYAMWDRFGGPCLEPPPP